MTARRASFTETEVRRALKAAKAEGYGRVELIPSPQGLKIVCEIEAHRSEAEENNEGLD